MCKIRELFRRLARVFHRRSIRFYEWSLFALNIVLGLVLGFA